MNLFKVVYDWSTVSATRSWRSHAVLSTSVIALVAGVSWGMARDGLEAACYAGLVMAVFFRCKEWLDWRKHVQAGDWETPEWEDHVTPKVDEKGDLLGAYTCCLLLWALHVAQKNRRLGMQGVF